MPRSLRTLLLSLAPLPAIAVGAAVAHDHGVTWLAFAPNLAGLALGSLAMFALLRAESERALAWLTAFASAAVLAAALLGPDVEGVRRWLPIGPLQLNASAAFAPWLIAGLAAAHARSRVRAGLLALIAQAAHLLQPDAGQATALAVGMLPLLLDVRLFRRSHGLALAGGLTTLAAGTWLRADPLPAVDHVERVLFLAAAQSPAMLIALGLAVAALAAPFTPLIQRGTIGLACLAYVATSFLVTFAGNFPVPVLGAGAGPCLGWAALLTGHLIAQRHTLP